MLLASYLFDKFGLRNGLVVGTLFQGIGAILKYFLNTDIWFLFIGQTFLGISEPFFLDSPSMVATYWFEDSFREIAITCGTNFNTIGIAFGFILPTFFVDSNLDDMEKARSQIALSLLVQGILGLTIMLLTIFSFQDKPAIAPSSNAVVEREDALCKSYHKLI
jgi:MFS family permease